MLAPVRCSPVCTTPHVRPLGAQTTLIDVGAEADRASAVVIPQPRAWERQLEDAGT